MRFKIYRTSIHDLEAQPHQKAFRAKTIVRDEVRKDWDGGTREEWRENGFNHRTEGDFLVRDLEVERWFIEINSLEELITFAKEVNQEGIIFNDETIEIYDSYRE